MTLYDTLIISTIIMNILAFIVVIVKYEQMYRFGCMVRTALEFIFIYEVGLFGYIKNKLSW